MISAPVYQKPWLVIWRLEFDLTASHSQQPGTLTTELTGWQSQIHEK